MKIHQAMARSPRLLPRLLPSLLLAVLLVPALLLAALLAACMLPRGAPLLAAEDHPGPPPTANSRLSANELQARGAYLARAGNCMTCHTATGGQPYAGGRVLVTPFGAFVTPNLTPDAATGLGQWSADDFWRALHHGVGRDGRLLYPAFPYPSYTRITRADADALYAWLRTVAAVHRPRTAHRLRFPYTQQWALAAWRALYFRPGVYQADAQQSVEWNRGAYLVGGLGHCSACHSPRNALGASSNALSGAMVPGQDWYAPALDAAHEAGVADWPAAHVTSLLKTGISPTATVTGPMADVVRDSLQYLNDADIAAMGVYLRTLPPATQQQSRAQTQTYDSPQARAFLAAGARVYERHCIDCHGADGRGQPPHYPPLAGNRALTMSSAVNPIRIILNGGFAPATAGNPRPYSMPPYSHVLDDTQVAQLLSYLRSAWGNHAAPVTAREVNRHRAVPVE